MRLYLHIGTGRTGTQSLQDFLKRNVEVLRENDIYYPLLENKNHHNALALPICGNTPPRYLQTRYSSDLDKNIEAFHTYFDKLESMIGDAGLGSVILSSEFLGRKFSANLGEILFSRLRAIFDEIKIIVYFRTPASYFLSSALQTLKASQVFNHPFKQNAKEIITSYEPLGANVIPQEYNRNVLYDQDVCRDFIHAIDPALISELTATSRQKNETLSAEVMSIIQQYRALIWPNARNQFNIETDTLLERLLEISNENDLYIKPRLRPEITEALNHPDEQMLYMRNLYGLNFADVNYDLEPTDMRKLPGTFERVEDICVVDPGVRDRILIMLLSELNNRTLDNATPKAEKTMQGAPDTKKAAVPVKKTPSKGEIERLKSKFPLLRRPEIEHYGMPPQIKRARKEKVLHIRKNFPEVKLADITSWAYNPLNHVVWRIYFNSFAWMAALARETDDGTALDADWDEIKRLLGLFLDYYDAHAEKTDSDIWDDHATGYRASYLAWLYAGGLIDHLTPEEDARLRRAIQKHRTVLMDYLASEKWKFSNHTLFQAEGLADLALVFLLSPARREETLTFAARRVDQFVRDAVTHEEGTVKEHSMFYHVFLMGRLVDTCSYFKAIEAPILSASDEMFTLMNQFLHDIMPVPGRLPGIGDSKHHQRFDRKYYTAFEGDRYSNPRIEFHKSGGERGQNYNFVSRYPSDGYFIFRSAHPQGQQLYSTFLHRSFRGPHGHWDGGSFVAYKGGYPVLIDSGGPYMYSTRMRYKYFMTALAHNALIFDRDPVQLSTVLLDEEVQDNYGCVAVGARMGQGRHWVRIFAQDDNMALIIMDLAMAATGDHTAEIRFHLDPGVTRKKSTLTGEFGEAVFAHSTLALDTATRTAIAARLDAGQSAELQSDRVVPSERTKGLDSDFDERSYVTYRDNEKEPAGIYLHSVPINHATLTSLNFAPTEVTYAMRTDGPYLSVWRTFDRVEEEILRFNLETLKLS